MSRMPRELDPEWLMRARLWASSWKTVLLLLGGFIWGATFMLIQFFYPGPQGLMGAMAVTGLYLALVAVVLSHG